MPTRVLLLVSLFTACDHCDVPQLTTQLGDVFPIDPTRSLPAPACVQKKHDAVIVLGCPDDVCRRARAELAKALQPGPFIVSGGAVHNTVVEADALAQLLDGYEVYREPRAEHTDENLAYSAEIMRAHGWKTAWVVSEDPAHLIYVALCDANCCVRQGRLSVFDHPSGGKVGHYVLGDEEPKDCEYLQNPNAVLCFNFPTRKSCVPK